MTFIELLNRNRTVLFDGGMGTELADRGCEMGGLSNLASPDAVVAIHRDYYEAGADVIITNTFTMNRINQESHKLDTDIAAANAAGARLARKAAGPDRLVFGDLGPTGQLLEPYGSYKEEQFYDNYAEQASILAAEGIDGLIIETMTDLREAVCAVKACREKTDLPLILSLAFTMTGKGGCTIMGNTVRETAEAAEELGLAAVGANCGDLDPSGMARIAALFKEATDLPVIIQPNAGRPKLIKGSTVFDMEPAEYARGIMECIGAGAMIVGGCCGTTPAHIKALKKLLTG